MARLLKVSSANAAFQRIEVLRRNRTRRHQYGEFVIEGVRAINGALRADWTIRSFAYVRGRALSQWAAEILERSGAESHLEVAPELFAQITDKDDPPELIAVVEQRQDSVDRIPLTSDLLVVVIDRPASPGNLGTILRSCDAFGASGVIVTGHGVDIYDPLVIRASVGSFFAVPCISLPSHREVAAWVDRLRISRRSLQLIGTSAHAEHSARDFSWPSDVVLVIGNETSGLSFAYREMCDTVVKIPMRGTATSLNAAIATSILLYEIDAHRRRE